MVTIEWSVRARTRVQEVYDYLFDKAGERVARKITGRIYARADILLANPRAGQRESVLEDSGAEFRYLVEGNYKIIYWIEPDRVTISTVFDCRRDPQHIREDVGPKVR